MAETPNFDSNNVKFDLEPFIKEAMDRISVEIDARVAEKAAVEMRKLGWVCIPPDAVAHAEHPAAKAARE